MKISFRKPAYIVISVFAISLCTLWVFYSRVDLINDGSLSFSTPKEGFLAPDFELENQNGEMKRLSEFQGSPVLVNFWASWCAPCRAEMPDIQNLHEKYSDDGLVILAVNSTSQDSVSKATQFVDSLHLTFPILFDTSGSVSETYQVRALPTTFFIDRYGVINEIVVGGPMSPALLQTRVNKLLGTKED
jgi:peroxiredoxin